MTEESVDVVGCSASNFAGAALSRPHAGRARKSRGNLNEVVIKKQSTNKQQVVDRFLPPYPRALQEGEAVRNKVGLFPHWCKGCFGELCGGVAQRWVLLYSEQRQPQAQRTVDKQWRQQSDEDVKAFKRLCRTAFACEADAQQALTRFEAGLQTAFLHDSTIGSTPHYGKRGRPGPGAQPDQCVYHITGALALRLTDRQARIDQQSCFILATNELDEEQLSAQAVLDGYKGQARAERSFRFLKDPQFLASSLYLKKPERVMALLMVMTVCLLVYAALEYRIRNALKDNAATFPDQKGKRIQHPTARWVFHYFVGIHVLYIPGQGLFVLNLTDEHQHLLQLLGKRYVWFYR